MGDYNPSDNMKVAIMSKINELAERFGIQSYQFCANLDRERAYEYEERERTPYLIVNNFSNVSQAQIAQFANALTGSRLQGTNIVLDGYPGEIIDTLNHALHVAPQSRVR
jgi:hypothetical protein